MRDSDTNLTRAATQALTKAFNHFPGRFQVGADGRVDAGTDDLAAGLGVVLERLEPGCIFGPAAPAERDELALGGEP